MNLTRRQQELLRIIEHRVRIGLPTVQRDLAEYLGIRRDSLNKLLVRTRRVLASQGRTLEMPPTARECRADVSTLSALSD